MKCLALTIDYEVISKVKVSDRIINLQNYRMTDRTNIQSQGHYDTRQWRYESVYRKSTIWELKYCPVVI